MKPSADQTTPRPPTLSLALATEQVWAALSPDQQTPLYQQLIHLCYSLVSLPTPQIQEASDER